MENTRDLCASGSALYAVACRARLRFTIIFQRSRFTDQRPPSKGEAYLCGGGEAGGARGDAGGGGGKSHFTFSVAVRSHVVSYMHRTDSGVGCS